MNKYNEIEIQTAKNLLEKGFKWITRGIYGAILAYKIKPDQEKYGYGNVICSDRVPIFESIRCGDEPVSLESIVYPQILDDDEKMNDDLISRQAAIESIRECAEAAHSMHDWDMEQGYINAIECIEEEPSAQTELEEIGYVECANAILKMWMDNVVTDGEYNRIMDKLNTHWRMKDE